jgi:hypothetical protein
VVAGGRGPCFGRVLGVVVSSFVVVRGLCSWGAAQKGKWPAGRLFSSSAGPGGEIKYYNTGGGGYRGGVSTEGEPLNAKSKKRGWSRNQRRQTSKEGENLWASERKAQKYGERGWMEEEEEKKMRGASAGPRVVVGPRNMEARSQTEADAGAWAEAAGRWGG